MHIDCYPCLMPNFIALFKRARAVELRKLREERGATDPILIIAGIAVTLILLVGGTFAVSGFMANARDLNVQSDLDRVATSMEASQATGRFDGQPLSVLYASGPKIEAVLGAAAKPQGNPGPSIDVVSSDGAEIYVTYIRKNNADPKSKTAWVAFGRSTTGSWFLRTELSNTTWDFGKVTGNAVTKPAGFDEAWPTSGYVLNPTGIIASLETMLAP